MAEGKDILKTNHSAASCNDISRFVVLCVYSGSLSSLARGDFFDFIAHMDVKRLFAA